MTTEDLEQMLTDGLSPEQAAPIRDAIRRESVKSRVSTLKQEREYNEIVAQQQSLQRELEGAPDKSVVGARAYQKWYNENYTAAVRNAEQLQKYVAKYGADPDAAPGPQATVDVDSIMRRVRDEVLPNYAPASAVVTAQAQQMKILQKHMFAGRKNPIDVDVLMRTAGEKYQGNLEQAYDEWDKPEREKAETASRDAEVTRRVNEELQKRGASQHFPAGADLTPSSLSARPKADVEKFDRTTLNQDLMKGWVSGETAS